MSTTPNKRSHEEGGNGSGGGSGNHGHSSASKFQHEDSGTFPNMMGRLESSTSGDYHVPYEMGQDARMPKLPRTESRDAERRSPLLPMYRVPSSSNDSHSDHPAGFDSRLESRDSKDGNKDPKFENHDTKVEVRELYQGSRLDKDVKFDSRGDDNKATRNERESYPEHRADAKMDKDTYGGASNYPNWKNLNEQHRGKRYPDASGGNLDPLHTSRSNLHGPAEGVKEPPVVEEREYAEAREAVGENKVDFKGEDKLKEKDRKRKEVKHRDWGERDKERNDRRNTLQLCSNSSSENKDPMREEREAERLDKERKDLLRDKEKVKEREKDFVKKEPGNGAEKESSLNGKEMLDVPNRVAELENPTSELKKQKDIDSWKNVDRDPGERKKERDAAEEGERFDKRNKNHDKESDEGCVEAEGGTEREREVFNCGVQQRKRMLRPRGSPQHTHRDPHFRSRNQDNEGYEFQ